VLRLAESVMMFVCLLRYLFVYAGVV